MMMNQEWRILLSDRDRNRLRELVTAYSGLDAQVQSDGALAQAVSQRLVANGLTSLHEYWPLLRRDPAAEGEMRHLVRLLTNKETFFFREKQHFEVLRDRILPELVTGGDRPLRIWSAGCATGEEPYSLAIALLEYQARRGKFPVQVIGTDIDEMALDQARHGCYGERALRQMPKDLRRRYFSYDGHQYCVTADLARLVTFKLHNLAEEDQPLGLQDLDIIFCRNVTIYFEAEARDRLNARLAQALREGGYLFVASAETIGHNRGRLELVSTGSTFLFRKAASLDAAGTGPSALSSSPGRVAAGPEPINIPPRPSILARLAVQEPAARAAPAAGGRAGEDVAPPASDPASILARARAAFQAHEFATALRELERLPAEQLVWTEAYRLQAAIYLQREQFKDAEAACQILLAHDPWNPDAHFLLGLIFRHQDQIETAVQSLKQTIYLQPSHRHAHYYLAEIYRALGMAQQAEAEYRNTLNILTGGPDRGSDLNLTGLYDEMLRQACQVNLSRLEGRRETAARGDRP